MSSSNLNNIVFLSLVWTISSLCEGYTFNLCEYFIRGGTCENSCRHEARHAWGIPFCDHEGAPGPRCCIPSQHGLLRKQTTPTPTTTTTLSITTRSYLNNALDDTNKCGLSASHSRVRRVVGGSRAPSGAWPWQVAIRLYTGQYVCGGVVVSDRWILTAAHCFQAYNGDTNYLRVYVGDQTLSFGRDGRDNTKTIRKIIMHEDFEQNIATVIRDNESGNTSTIYRHVHDIALIELEERLVFGSRLRPACLPDRQGEVWEEVSRGNDCWVYGWGEDMDTDKSTVTELREARGSVISSRVCAKKWGASFSENVVCFESKGSGPCTGDSGGGLTCRHSNGRSYLMGIISWGREDCVHDDHPSVQTNVQSHLDWIASHIDE